MRAGSSADDEGTENGDGDRAADWRKVLKTSLAVPARWAGTPSRTTPVTEGMARDLPAPIAMMQIAISQAAPASPTAQAMHLLGSWAARQSWAIGEDRPSTQDTRTDSPHG